MLGIFLVSSSRLRTSGITGTKNKRGQKRGDGSIISSGNPRPGAEEYEDNVTVSKFA